MLAGVAALALVACSEGPPTIIDGSSPEAFQRTVAEARRDIPDADRLIYDRALRTVGGRSHSTRDADALARVTFNGMTAAEVVEDQRYRDNKGGE